MNEVITGPMTVDEASVCRQLNCWIREAHWHYHTEEDIAQRIVQCLPAIQPHYALCCVKLQDVFMLDAYQRICIKDRTTLTQYQLYEWDAHA